MGVSPRPGALTRYGDSHDRAGRGKQVDKPGLRQYISPREESHGILSNRSPHLYRTLAGSTPFVPASRAAVAAEPDPSFAPPTTDHKIAIRSAFQEHVPNQPGAGSTY